VNAQTVQEPRWFPLESRRSGKKKSHVTGDIQIQFSLVDASNPNASADDIMRKWMGFTTNTPSPDEDEDDEELLRSESADMENAQTDDEDSSDEPQDESKKAEKREKRRKKLRLARLKRKANKLRAYEFSDKTEVAGVLFLEITKVTDLPPEKNGASWTLFPVVYADTVPVTRTSFDMDPFVVTSLGKKTYRTKTISHNLNPVYDEKLVFQVLRHETNYSVNFTVIDKDKFSGNDYVGTVAFPLEKAVSIAPEADPTTGLYKLPEPSDSPGTVEARRSRFRLPMSRSSSAHSLSRLGRPGLKKENSTSSLSAKDFNEPLPPAPTSIPPTSGNESGPSSTTPVPIVKVDPTSVDDQDLKMFTLPIEMKNKDRWEAKHHPTLHIRAKYLPYKALRQQFWRAMLKQYDADDSGLIDKVELTTMLDTLGSTLHESTIDGFFKRFMAEHNGEELLTFDQVVMCLEDQLHKTEEREAEKNVWNHLSNASNSNSDLLSRSEADLLNASQSGLVTPGSMISGTSGTDTPFGTETPLNAHASSTSIPGIQTDQMGQGGEAGDFIKPDELGDEKGEEHVIEIRECPICHQPRLNKKSDANIITHVATCASQDWRQVNNIVMGGFVTSSQAQRKWYSKVITKISYGGYKLGANSANILVQDRLTGQINEERMSVYVRLGIRLLYKGLKANNMEKKRSRSSATYVLLVC
jgi:phosphatidylserine decarboxylase